MFAESDDHIPGIYFSPLMADSRSQRSKFKLLQWKDDEMTDETYNNNRYNYGRTILFFSLKEYLKILT